MDLSVVYYTANRIHPLFAGKVRRNILKSAPKTPIISVSQQPINFGKNIVVEDFEPSHLNIYRQALIGAKEATTRYIACCEDDVLYTFDHFKHRPSEGKFGYNLSVWNMFTWGDPVFHRKDGGRRNMYSLICERDLFIEAMEERFDRWPDDSKINLGLWAEPSKYERQLQVTVREWEPFYSNPPIIAFSHQTALSFNNLGTRKKMGQITALEVPFWGDAKSIRSIYR